MVSPVTRRSATSARWARASRTRPPRMIVVTMALSRSATRLRVLDRAPVDLSLHEHRVPHAPAVADARVARDAHGAGLLVDLDLADLRAVGERDRRRSERRLLAEARLHPLRKLARHVGGARDVGERHAAVGALHGELPVLVDHVLGSRLEQARGDPSPALDDLLGRARHRRAADGEGARAAVATAGAEQVAVAPEHLDALGRDAELLADDLRKRRLVALAHRRRAREQRDGAV